MAKKKGWTVARLRVATKRRLVAHCQAMAAATQAGMTSRELSDRQTSGGVQGGLTLDRAINDLLDRDDAHRERARRAQAKKRARPGGQNGAAAGPAGETVVPVTAADLGYIPWDNTPRVYFGRRVSGRAVVSVVKEPDGGDYLSPRRDLYDHSPDGFEWGYAGSGPAQLALAILADATDDETALTYYQQFKRERIATLPPEGPWWIGHMEVVAWVAGRKPAEKGGGG